MDSVSKQLMINYESPTVSLCFSNLLLNCQTPQECAVADQEIYEFTCRLQGNLWRVTYMHSPSRHATRKLFKLATSVLCGEKTVARL